MNNRIARYIQFIKFGLVGISNTIVFYITYCLLIFLGFHYLIASLLGFLFGVLNSFYFNNKFVFKKGKLEARNPWLVLIKTLISYGLTSYVIGSILLVLFIEGLGISKYIAPFLGLMVKIPLNFILNKNWAYKSSKMEEKSD